MVEDVQTKYRFHVPEQERIHMIVHFDCKNEVNDPFATENHLFTITDNKRTK